MEPSPSRAKRINDRSLAVTHPTHHRAIDNARPCKPACPNPILLLYVGRQIIWTDSSFQISWGSLWLKENRASGVILSHVEYKPPIDAVKFGTAGPNGDRYVYSYTRHAYLNRQYWFRQVEAGILLN